MSKALQFDDGSHSGTVDQSLIEYTLSLSYEARIEAHEVARQLANDLTEAGKKYRAEQSQKPA